MPDIELSGVPFATGSEASISALVLADGAIKRAPVNKANVLAGQNLPAGNTVLTLALARSGPLYSTASDATSLYVPLLANFSDLGSYVFTPNAPNGLLFAVERQGTGVLAVNFAPGVTINWNNLDTTTLGTYSGIVMIRMVALNVWVAG